MVYRLAYARTGNRMDADDVFQEVFLKLVEATPTLQSAEHLKAWLIRTTLNRCNSLWRRASRRKTIPLHENIAAQDQEDLGVLDAVTRLSPKYRAVIHLFYYEDMTVEEVSRMLKQKPSTTRTQLTRARRMLGEQLRAEEANRYAETGI